MKDDNQTKIVVLKVEEINFLIDLCGFFVEFFANDNEKEYQEEIDKAEKVSSILKRCL